MTKYGMVDIQRFARRELFEMCKYKGISFDWLVDKIRAAIMISANYATDDVCLPTKVIFANGRMVSIAFNENHAPYLQVHLVRDGYNNEQTRSDDGR